LCWIALVSFSAATKIFIFAAIPKPVVGFIRPPIQWVPGVKRSELQEYHSPSSSVMVIMSEALPLHDFTKQCVVVQHSLLKGTGIKRALE
jgi:hypothetical protein